MHSIGENVISYNELYLFMKIRKQIDVMEIYQTITNNWRTDFTRAHLVQLLHNLDLPIDENPENKTTYDDRCAESRKSRPGDLDRRGRLAPARASSRLTLMPAPKAHLAKGACSMDARARRCDRVAADHWRRASSEKPLFSAQSGA